MSALKTSKEKQSPQLSLSSNMTTDGSVTTKFLGCFILNPASRYVSKIANKRIFV
jgi:hypothetical protein